MPRKLICKQKLGNNSRLEMGRKKRQKKPSIEEDTSNLPCEVIITILSKLPVKSLLRSRCVCKPWRALISEPQFIKSHLSEAIKSGRQRVICSVLLSDPFYNVDYETCGKSDEELLYFPIKKYQKASVLCSCNGLVLLGLQKDKLFVLWNPSTREYKKFSCPYSEIYLNSFYEICYDSSVDDYKVLIINKKGNILVYTRKTNSWTEIKGFPDLGPHGEGVTVSGVSHWIVALKKGHNLGYLLQMHGLRGGNIDNSLTPTDDPSKASETSFSNNSSHCHKVVPSYVDESYTIVFFDLVEEKIKEMPTPKRMWEGDLFDLTVMRGCLGLYINSRDRHQVDVWVMEEYGVRNSWSKYFTIPCNIGPTVLGYLKLVSFTEKGQAVMLNHNTIFLYDPKENKLRDTMHSSGMVYPTRMVSYVDSLVLPTCDKLAMKQQHKHKESGKMKEL